MDEVQDAESDIAKAITFIASQFEGVQPRMLISREDNSMTLEWHDREAGVGIVLLISDDGTVCAASRFPGHGYAEGFKLPPSARTTG